MLTYVARRIVATIPVMAVVALFVFSPAIPPGSGSRLCHISRLAGY
jgi:hypothetical protein